MPLVKKPRVFGRQEDGPRSEEVKPELIVEPGDLTFDAQPLDLMRRTRRICDNARTTVEERGVTTLHPRLDC